MPIYAEIYAICALLLKYAKSAAVSEIYSNHIFA